MKKYYVWGLLLVISIGLVNAQAYKKYIFYDTNDAPVTNMQVIGWYCVDTDCTQVTTKIPQLAPNGLNTGTNNFIDITLPTINQRYLILFFSDNYIYQYARTTPTGAGRRSDVIISNANPPAFTKKSNCKAPSSLTVQNKIGEWLPLTIDTTSQLDTQTASAIHYITTTYYPPDAIFQKYVQVATNVNLQIKDKKTNAVVYQESRDLMIPWDSTLPTSFSWDSSDPDYKSGNYTVILTSHVTDTKCSSVIDDVKTQDIEVFPELPDDACVIIADPVTLKNPITKGQMGQLDISSYFYHMLKTYDDNYDMHLTYKGVAVDYTLTFTNISGRVDRTITGSFPKAFTDTRTDAAPTKAANTVNWAPGTYGEYDVSLVMTSEDPLCVDKENDFTRGTRTDTVTIGMRDRDADGSFEDVDCNDNNANINPGASDTTCDGIDQNCDGFDRTSSNQCTCIENSKKFCSEFQRLGMCGQVEVTCTNGAFPACPTRISSEVCDDGTLQDEDCPDVNVWATRTKSAQADSRPLQGEPTFSRLCMSSRGLQWASVHGG